MTTVIQDIGAFFSIALVAMLVENAVLTRGLGVSRLVKIVGDSSVDGLVFFALLTLIQVISMPMAFFVNAMLAERGHVLFYWLKPDYLRPLAYVLCAAAAFIVVLLGISIVRLPNMKEMAAVLPVATFNGAVLGPLLITSTQNYTFGQCIGFALGSGLGYGLAVMVLTEGQRKMNNRNVPTIFRGLPINLIYIGILALAVYGLTGHRVAI